MALPGGADHVALAKAQRLLENRHLLNEEQAKSAAAALSVLLPELERRVAEKEAQTETERLHRELQRTRAEAKRLLDSLEYFFVQAWEHVEDAPLKMGRHINLMCRYLQALDEGELPNGEELRELLVNIPPGHSKSICVTVIYVAWVFAHNPKAWVVTVSYSDELAKHHLALVRKLMESDWYLKHFPDSRIGKPPGGMKQVDTTTEFTMEAGGKRTATTPKKALTGMHPTHLVIDDPQNPERADKKSDRDFIRRWWNETASNRGLQRFHRGKQVRRMVCVMQRLHQLDLSGHLQTIFPQIHHVCLPARYEKNRMRDLGIGPKWQDWRTEEGQLLFPELFPAIITDSIERQLGAYGVAGQQQQRPTARGGGMFKVSRIEIVDETEIPYSEFTVVCRAWDFASSDGKGDYTVGLLLAIVMDLNSTRATVYILDMRRGQWATDEKENMVDTFSRMDLAKYSDKYFVTIPKDPAAAGKDVVSFTRRRLRDVPIRSHPVSGNKSIKATPAATAVNDNEFKMRRAEWNFDLLDELENFPNGEHDDICDALAEGFKALVNGDDWFLGGLDEEDAESVYGRDCAYYQCNRKAAPDNLFCCECCEAAAEDGIKLDDDLHSPSCNYRHSNLHAKGVWNYDRPVLG